MDDKGMGQRLPVRRRTPNADASPTRLTPEQAYQQLEAHPGWIVDRTRLHRDVRFPSFRDAVDFVVAVADVAEAHAHHPNILIHEWCFVRLELYSHVIDGLSQADVDVAMAIDGLITP